MKLTCAALLAAVAFAQTPSNDKPATIEGRIVNAVTGEVVRKAQVTLIKDPTEEEVLDADVALETDVKDEHDGSKRFFSATSDSSGKFRFERLAAGEYLMAIKHAGFVDLVYRAPNAKRTDPELVHLQSGQQLRDLELRLTPEGAVAGKVVDEDGDPVADAVVTASAANYASGDRKMEVRDSTNSDDHGEFRLGQLPPGRYYIAAQRVDVNPEAPPPADGKPEENYVRTYYPKSLDPNEAQMVAVKGGADVAGLTIQLQKSRVVRISGNVQGPEGKPLIGATIMLMPEGQFYSAWSVTAKGPDGRFEVANVPPGAYSAMITRMATGFQMQQPLMVPAKNLTGVRLGAGAMAEGTVAGRVSIVGDGKIPVKGQSVGLLPDGMSQIMPEEAKTDEGGAFVLKKVLPARYRLNVFSPAGTYLKSVLWNGKEVLGDAIDYSGGTAGELQIFLGTDGGTFQAKVSRDDRPVAEATVILLPEDPSQRHPENVRRGTTDDAGHAALRDVPPGHYLAIAWEKIEEGDWFDPVVLRAAQSSAVRVTIGAKESQQADLKAIAAQ